MVARVLPFNRRGENSIDNMVTRALWATELEVFLRRRAADVVTLSTVSISFNTQLEAQEFKRLLLRRGKTGTQPNHKEKPCL